MISYYTSTPKAPPVSDAQRAAAMKGMGTAPQYGYGQDFDDNFTAAAGRNKAAFDMSAQEGNADYLSKQQEQEQRSVLSGLQMMAEERKRTQDLGNQRINTLGQFSGLLSGLYR